MMASRISSLTSFSGRWSLISWCVRKPRVLPILMSVFSSSRRLATSSSVSVVSSRPNSRISARSLARLTFMRSGLALAAFSVSSATSTSTSASASISTSPSRSASMSARSTSSVAGALPALPGFASALTGAFGAALPVPLAAALGAGAGLVPALASGFAGALAAGLASATAGFTRFGSASALPPLAAGLALAAVGTLAAALDAVLVSLPCLAAGAATGAAAGFLAVMRFLGKAVAMGGPGTRASHESTSPRRRGGFESRVSSGGQARVDSSEVQPLRVGDVRERSLPACSGPGSPRFLLLSLWPLRQTADYTRRHRFSGVGVSPRGPPAGP